MRMLFQVSMPVEKGNDLSRKGALASTIKKILEELKPEAAYFAAIDGKRTGMIIFDVKDASDIPRLAEPFFLALDARIDVHPVMTPHDLEAAGPGIAAAVKKFGK